MASNLLGLKVMHSRLLLKLLLVVVATSSGIFVSGFVKRRVDQASNLTQRNRLTAWMLMLGPLLLLCIFLIAAFFYNMTFSK